MFNRSEIMKAAWNKHDRYGVDMSTALRQAWYEAKTAAPIWSVCGDGELIASGLTYDEAGEMRWKRKNRYWNMDIKAA